MTFPGLCTFYRHGCGQHERQSQDQLCQLDCCWCRRGSGCCCVCITDVTATAPASTREAQRWQRHHPDRNWVYWSGLRSVHSLEESQCGLILRGGSKQQRKNIKMLGLWGTIRGSGVRDRVECHGCPGSPAIFHLSSLGSWARTPRAERQGGGGVRRELGLFTVSGGSDAANLRSPNLFSDLDIKSTGQLKTESSFVSSFSDLLAVGRSMFWWFSFNKIIIGRNCICGILRTVDDDDVTWLTEFIPLGRSDDLKRRQHSFIVLNAS